MSERSHILGALAFEKVLTVKIGGVVRGIRIPAVLEDTLSMMRIAMLRAKARGAQRIGFILPSSYDEFVGGDWDMAYLRSQMEVGEMSFLPILRSCCRENGSLWNQEDGRAKELGQLCAWIDQWRPDCVIGFTEQTKSDISELGLNIPDDLAYIHLLARPSCSQSAGLQDHREFVGEIAAELLIRAIRQRREPPLFGTKTVVESHWQNGASLPAKRLGLSADDSGRFEARLSSPIELFRV
jgi:DNA-binding LacI/PurR family transcriptional regulator